MAEKVPDELLSDMIANWRRASVVTLEDPEISPDDARPLIWNLARQAIARIFALITGSEEDRSALAAVLVPLSHEDTVALLFLALWWLDELDQFDIPGRPTREEQ